MNNRVFIVNGKRTPFLKSNNVPGPFTSSDLATHVGRELVNNTEGLHPNSINEAILGCAAPSSKEMNIARIVALRSGCINSTVAHTVQRNCGSGLLAITEGFNRIKKEVDVVLVGGTEAMSHAPMLLTPEFTTWLVKFNKATIFKRVKMLSRLSSRMLVPVHSLLNALKDPLLNKSMGQIMESYDTSFTREDMDEFSINSHKLASLSQHNMLQILPMYDSKGNYYNVDTGVRSDTTKLTNLRSIFSKFGTITAGNSSQVSDGACLLLLASEEAVKRDNLSIMGEIIDYDWSATDPTLFGVAPVKSTLRLLSRNDSHVPYLYEINEAFALQTLEVIKQLNEADIGLNINSDNVNVNGGAIAIGHPVGATGARLVLNLLTTLPEGKSGLATLCVGGGQAGSILVKKVSGV